MPLSIPTGLTLRRRRVHPPLVGSTKLSRLDFPPQFDLLSLCDQMSMTLAPLLWVWAFGVIGDNVFGTPIKWGLLAVIVGVPVGATVWRTTRIRKMPSSGSYRLFFALVAFLSCVAWIYYLAALAVDFVEVGFWLGASAEPHGQG